MFGNFEQLIHLVCITSCEADALLDAGGTVVIKIEMVSSSWNVQSTGNIEKSAGCYTRVVKLYSREVVVCNQGT